MHFENINFFCAESWPAWASNTPRFWCVEAKFQGESIYDNFEDGDHQRIKENRGAQLMGCISQLFQILFLEENN